VLVFSKAFIALNAQPRRVATFFSSMLATWLLGGWLMAYSFSAAGPVFAHLFDPSLGPRFHELRDILAGSLMPDGAIRGTQRYLASAIDVHTAVQGGGISAMPSMHLGATSVYVMAARGTRWIVPAILFWVIIFVGSGYFGYHYWIDGIIAAAVAVVCWKVAEAYYEERQSPAPQVAVSHA
jgi:hypothetical protein